MFGLFKKKAPEDLDPRFVSPADLVYAKYKKGDPWKDHDIKKNMRDRFPLLDFSKAYKKCIKYGLIQESADGKTEMTDRARELLARHDYIEFCAKHLPYKRVDFSEMCATRNREPNAALYDVIMSGLDKKEFVERYVDWYMEDEEDDWDAQDRADRKREAKEDAKEEYQEIMDKIKALKKEGKL